MMNTKLRMEPSMLAAFAQELHDASGRLPPKIPLVTIPSGSSARDVAMLRAQSRRWLRKTLIVLFGGYLIVTPALGSSKAISFLLAFVVLGTYRETFISKSSVTWKIFLAFIPVGTWVASIENAQCLYSEWEEQGGMMEAMMLGLWGLLVAPLLDWLCPWRNGLFMLWINDERGQKILVWRGRSERAFHSNHRLVQSITHLPSPRDLQKLSS